MQLRAEKWNTCQMCSRKSVDRRDDGDQNAIAIKRVLRRPYSPFVSRCYNIHYTNTFQVRWWFPKQQNTVGMTHLTLRFAWLINADLQAIALLPPHDQAATRHTQSPVQIRSSRAHPRPRGLTHSCESNSESVGEVVVQCRRREGTRRS